MDDADLRAAVQRLPFKQRAAVAYRYLADLPYAEIAVLLDCSEAAARRSAADGIAAPRTHVDPVPTKGTPMIIASDLLAAFTTDGDDADLRAALAARGRGRRP